MKKLALLVSTASVLALASPAKALTNYALTPSTGGTVDPTGTFVTGSNVDNLVVSVIAPFNFTIYNTPVAQGQTIRVSTNGNIQFTPNPTGGAQGAANNALRSTTFGNFPVIAAYWDDLLLTTPGGGIFTSTSGTVGNRVFDIEWRGRRNGDGQTAQNINFEVRFFENSGTFEIVYGQTGFPTNVNANGASATVGVQAGNTASSSFTQLSFNRPIITPGLKLTATVVPFGFTPVSALAFIGANLLRRRSKVMKPEKVTQ